MIKFKYNDGGRANAGYKGTCGDCAVRAIAIASGKPYKEVYTELNKIVNELRSDGKITYSKTVRKRLLEVGLKNWQLENI